MEFTVRSLELAAKLARVIGAVERKTTIPILSNVLIEATETGLWLTATDLELAIRVACDSNIRRVGSGTVPAKRLLDWASALPDGDVSVKWLDNQSMTAVCGRSRMRLSGMSRESFPQMPAMPDEASGAIGALGLAAMIARTVFAISSEESRFTLNGALLVMAPSGVTMVATDGHRLAHVVLPDAGQVEREFHAVVPVRALRQLARWEGDENQPVEIAADDQHLYFSLGDCTLSTRRIVGKFPEYERVLPQVEAHAARLAKADLGSALQRVSQFASGESHAVRVTLATDEMRIYGAQVDSGESEESVRCEYAGPEVEIGFNAAYLADFVKVAARDHLWFRVTDSKAACEMRPEGDDSYRYVVMPLRILSP